MAICGKDACWAIRRLAFPESPELTALISPILIVALAALTVKVAPLLVTFPTLLLTTTVKTVPLSDATVAGVVYEALVAPLILSPPFRHW